MSNINIKRAVENIRANTTVYTPVVEMIVNAIQAIDESGRTDGKVSVRALRNSQAELFGSLPDVTSFDIQDNGIGFTDEHRDSFDTLYTDRRIGEGGKGFGRFTCLKYFEDLHVKSVYREGSGFKCRSFSMGKDHDIIVREEKMVSEHRDSRTGTAGRREPPRSSSTPPCAVWDGEVPKQTLVSKRYTGLLEVQWRAMAAARPRRCERLRPGFRCEQPLLQIGLRQRP